MRFLEVGGARVSVIGLGTWQFGSMEWGYGPQWAQTTAGTLVKRALELGVNLVVDTAEIYGFGRSERIVGEALAEAGRDRAFLATKLFPLLPVARVVEWRARGSARRLRTGRLDLYQLHWPSPQVPLGHTMAALARLQREGVVGHVGVSNYPLGRWRRAEAALGAPVLSNQVEFSLVALRPRERLVPYAAEKGRIVIAYSPLGKGLLGGRYGTGRRPRDLIRRRDARFSGPPAVTDLVTALKEIGARHGATPAQVALAWVVGHPNTVAIPGASSVEQLEQNIAAADLELSGEESARLLELARRVSS